MTDIVVITNEDVRPITNGGRVRMAAIIDSLSARFDVRVIEPIGQRSSLAQTFRLAPRRGTTPQHGPIEVGDARVLLYTHSYLEPVGPRRGLSVVVDFPNLEVDRQRSLAAEGALSRRVSAAVEAVKALMWEPRTARRATIAVAVTDADADVLRRWGAKHVVVVPNAAAGADLGPSPANGPVTFLANHAYAPNAAASERLVRDVWPLVLAQRPDARLRVCGRGTDDEVDDITPVFAEASMLLTPVDEGGGTQLKVIEALAHGRVVVATTYSAESAPPGARDACIATVDASDMADAIVRLLDDVDDRHRRERSLAGVIPTWTDVTTPLVDAIATFT